MFLRIAREEWRAKGDPTKWEEGGQTRFRPQAALRRRRRRFVSMATSLCPDASWRATAWLGCCLDARGEGGRYPYSLGARRPS